MERTSHMDIIIMIYYLYYYYIGVQYENVYYGTVCAHILQNKKNKKK